MKGSLNLAAAAKDLPLPRDTFLQSMIVGCLPGGIIKLVSAGTWIATIRMDFL